MNYANINIVTVVCSLLLVSHLNEHSDSLHNYKDCHALQVIHAADSFLASGES